MGYHICVIEDGEMSVDMPAERPELKGYPRLLSMMESRPGAEASR
jgi:hypothetical protein